MATISKMATTNIRITGLIFEMLSVLCHFQIQSRVIIGVISTPSNLIIKKDKIVNYHYNIYHDTLSHGIENKTKCEHLLTFKSCNMSVHMSLTSSLDFILFVKCIVDA